MQEIVSIYPQKYRKEKFIRCNSENKNMFPIPKMMRPSHKDKEMMEAENINEIK